MSRPVDLIVLAVRHLGETVLPHDVRADRARLEGLVMSRDDRVSGEGGRQFDRCIGTSRDDGMTIHRAPSVQWAVETLKSGECGRAAQDE